MSTRAEQFTVPCTFHGEGPFWDVENDRLLLVDMLAGAVVEVDADGGTQRRQARRSCRSDSRPPRRRLRARHGEPVRPAWARPDRADGAAAGLHRPADPHERRRLRSPGPLLLRNDGVRRDPGSRDPVPPRSRWQRPRHAPRGDHLERVAVEPGGDTVFYADTPTGRVDSFTFDPASAAFTDRRTFTEISGGGHPDGMAIDEEDGIWVALWGGGAVHRYDSEGRLDLVVELPVSNVTACAFGGPDLRTLFITTSRQGLDEDDQPEAGAVFRYEAGVRGAPQHAFAG